MLIDLRGSVKGSTHDFKMFQTSGLLNILLSERNRYITMFPNKPAPTALFDKGYIGIKNIYPGAEIPFKKTRNGLTEQQQNYNENISHDRVIVERWFGRHKSLWKIMFSRFSFKLDRYEMTYIFCSALTNFHIFNYPLTENDPVVPGMH